MRSEYLNNKKLAGSILVTSVIMLVGTVSLNCFGINGLVISILSFLSEAILVASVADWFAITALTDKIFNIKITGMIENKREELIDGIVEAFQVKFMPKDKIISLSTQYRIVQIISENFKKNLINEGAPQIGKHLSKLLSSNRKNISNSISNTIISYIKNADVSGLIIKIKDNANKKGWIDDTINMIFDKIEVMVNNDSFKSEVERAVRAKNDERNNRGNFLKRGWNKFLSFAAEKTNVLNFSEFASDLQYAIKSVLQDVREKNNYSGENYKWLELKLFFTEVFGSLSKNKQITSLLIEIKNDMTGKMNIQPIIYKLLKVFEEWLEDGTISLQEVTDSFGLQIYNEDGNEKIDINKFISDLLSSALCELEKNDSFIQMEFVKLTSQLVENEYDECLDIVKEILSRLSNQNLKDNVNKVAGGSLQWLRVSGAYVGLSVGIILFCVVQWPTIFLPIFTLGFILVAFVPAVKKRLIVTRD